MGGPAAAATAPTAAQIETALRRSSAGNSGRRRASEVGKTEAAPTACSTRAATSSSTEGAAADRAEATVKIARPATKLRLRPSRSAVRPAGTSRAAKTIAYALRIHESDARLVPPKSRSMAGNAMFTMKRSRLAMNTAADTTIRTRHL